VLYHDFRKLALEVVIVISYAALIQNKAQFFIPFAFLAFSLRVRLAVTTFLVHFHCAFQDCWVCESKFASAY